MSRYSVIGNPSGFERAAGVPQQPGRDEQGYGR